MLEVADGDDRFQWVKLALDMLFGDYIKERAAIYQRLDDMRQSVAWSKDLDSMYAEIHRHNVAGTERDRTIADEVYQIVADCFLPLTAEELLEVLAFKTQGSPVQDPRYILRITRNLLVQNAASGVVRFCHLSAFEFISRMQGESASSSDIHRRHGLMADMCLTYLQQPSNYTLRKDDIDTETFWEVVLDPVRLFIYASAYWLRHCDLARDYLTFNRNLTSNLLRFVSTDSVYYSAWRSAIFESPFRSEAYDSPDVPSLLIMAVLRGWEALKPQLIELWTSKDITPDGKTVLHHAASVGDYSTAEAVLKRCSNTIIDRADKSNVTALGRAIVSRHLEVVQLLLDHGASVLNCFHGQTALHAAGADPLRLELLLKHLSNAGQAASLVNTMAPPRDAPSRDLDSHTRTPLHLLVDHRSDDNDEVIEAAAVLLRYGADINALDEMGDSVIGRAMHSFIPFRPKLLRFLLDNGANPNPRPGTWLMSPRPPLRALCERPTTDEILEAVPLLVHHGADPNQLRAAILYQECNVDFLRALIVAGANVNDMISIDEGTPLHTAARCGDHQAVSLLLEYGADVHLGTWRGLSAADTAFEAGYIDVAKVLRKHEFIYRRPACGQQNQMELLNKRLELEDALCQDNGLLTALDLEPRFRKPRDFLDPSMPLSDAIVARRFPEHTFFSSKDKKPMRELFAIKQPNIAVQYRTSHVANTTPTSSQEAEDLVSRVYEELKASELRNPRPPTPKRPGEDWSTRLGLDAQGGGDRVGGSSPLLAARQFSMRSRRR